MTKDQRIRQLEAGLKAEIENVHFLRSCLSRLEKRHAELKRGITRIHPVDQGFMMAEGEKHTDRDLFDVFNELLYSFGRPDKDGTVYTRLSCPY